MADFSKFIGNSEEFFESIGQNQVQKICATLGNEVLKNGDELPKLWQWCFFVTAYEKEFLGRDGHPKLAHFMPDVAGRNRMWAGGRFEFIRPLIIGKDSRKKTTIKNIQEKHGKSGSLLFVTLLHEYFQDDILCVSEEQDIVYKEPTPPKLSSGVEAQKADFSSEFNPNETELFRYSALTFNGHRIHYDFPYATETEGYKGLVIHGPLLATRMIETFAKFNSDKKITKYSYRGLCPLCVPTKFSVEGKIIEGNKAETWINVDGFIAHQGQIEFI